jgi:hypothetical protein
MPGPTSTPSGGGLRALLVLPLVAGWVALLLVPGLQPEWLASSFLARFAPLGFLAVFAFSDRGLRLTRVLFVAAPAFVLGTTAAAVAIAWRIRDAGLPGPSDLLLPALAVALGIVVALAWRRGPFALLLLPFKLAFLALLAAVLAAGLLFTLAEREPAVAEAPRVTAEEKQQLVALFQGKDPRALTSGEVCTLRLTQPEVDRLAAWILPFAVSPGRARVAIILPADETVEARASLPLPLDRWLNVSASGRVLVESGRFELRQPRLRFGRLVMPEALADALAPLLAAAIRAERPLRPVLAAIREARVERGAVRVSYGHIDMPRCLVGDHLWGQPPPAGEPRPPLGSGPTPRPPVERTPDEPARR